MAFEKILIVEDDAVIRNLLEKIFLRHRLLVNTAENLSQAAAHLAREQFDLMLLDLRLPDGDGLKFLETISTRPDRPLVVMITGFGTIESAVASMRAGAFDYLLKPFSTSQIDVILRKAQTYHQLLKVNRLLTDDAVDEDGALVGRSPAMVRLRQIIDRVAPTDATVLITGESGTGKEMVSREFYRRSPRRNEPFIKVNCAAVSQTLIESEFFGHERGAFTGATEQKVGRFELAHGGTIFLDEVGEIPLELQSKLLRVLQEQEFERLGSTRTVRVDIRLIAATNRDLAKLVEQQEFRSDLYYRLNVFPITLPPLRDRREDIPLLIRYFTQLYAARMKKPIDSIPGATLDALSRYHWPGNIRELENLVERAVILTQGTHLQVPLPELKVQAQPAPAPAVTLHDAEREQIMRTLRDTRWVIGGPDGAAARLGLKRTTLTSKIKKLGISRPRE